MSEFWKVVGTVLFVIAIYVVLTNYNGFNQIINSLGGFGVAETGTLQGRTVNTGFGMGGVSVGGLAASNSGVTVNIPGLPYAA